MDAVVLTRLAVTYEALPADELTRSSLRPRAGDRPWSRRCRRRARRPGVLGQPRTLELGADVGVTGLDKYGVTGPRLGLLGGRRDLVDTIRARAIELGLEARPLLVPAAFAASSSIGPNGCESSSRRRRSSAMRSSEARRSRSPGHRSR